MIDAAYVDLMHYEMDGVITSEDRERLRQYLVEHPEAQAFYNDLTGVSNMLAEVQTVDPPPNLKKHILNRLPKNKYSRTAKPKVSSGWLGFLQRRPRLGLSLSFAVGLAGGFIVFSLLAGLPDMNDSDLLGTMQRHDSSENLQRLSKLEIAEDEFSMNLELKRTEDFVLAVMQVTADKELEFVIEFDPNDLRFSGFQRGEQTQNNLRMDDGRVSLRHVGHNSYIFAFTDTDSSISNISLKVYDGELIYENTLSSGRKRK